MSKDGFLSAFCYLGLLRFPEQLESALALLPEIEKIEVPTILAGIRDLPKEELLRRWSDLRIAEYVNLQREVRDQSGVCIDELPSLLRKQWVDWLKG